MSDDHLREMERRWKQSGSGHEGGLFLIEKVRLGLMRSDHLEALGMFGYEPALSALEISKPPSFSDAVYAISSISGDEVVRVGIALAYSCLQSCFGNVDSFFPTDHFERSHWLLERWFVTKSLRYANAATQKAIASENEEMLFVHPSETPRAMDFIEASEVLFGLNVITAIVDIPQQDLHSTIQIVLRTIELVQKHFEEDDYPDPKQLVRDWVLADLVSWWTGVTDPIADRVTARI